MIYSNTAKAMTSRKPKSIVDQHPVGLVNQYNVTSAIYRSRDHFGANFQKLGNHVDVTAFKI